MAVESNTENREHASKNLDIHDRIRFPKWYWFMVWIFPIAFATVVGLSIGLMLTGYLALPAVFSGLAWAPSMIASLESGVSTFLAVTVAVGSLASLSYLGALLFARAITAHVAEKIAMNNQRECSRIEKELQSTILQMKADKVQHEIELVACEREISTLERQYNQLFGATKPEMVIQSAQDTYDAHKELKKKNIEPKSNVTQFENFKDSANTNNLSCHLNNNDKLNNANTNHLKPVEFKMNNSKSSTTNNPVDNENKTEPKKISLKK